MVSRSRSPKRAVPAGSGAKSHTKSRSPIKSTKTGSNSLPMSSQVKSLLSKAKSVKDLQIILPNSNSGKNGPFLYPLISFGTYKLDKDQTKRCSEYAVETCGYPLVDSAKVYDTEGSLKGICEKKGEMVMKNSGKVVISKAELAGKDESSKGKEVAILNSVSKTVEPIYPMIQTKLWMSQHGYAGAIKGFNESLKTLGIMGAFNGKVKEEVKKATSSSSSTTVDLSSKSLSSLQKFPLDSLLIHHPGPKRGWPLKNQPNGEPGVMPSDWQGHKTRYGTWQAMEDLYLDGRVNVIGVCNYSVRQLKDLLNEKSLRVKPMVLQVEFHPFLIQKDLLQLCDDNGILLQAYASLGGSEARSKEVKSGLSEPGKADDTLLTNPLINELAKSYKVQPSSILLRWALQMGCCIVPKSSNETRIKNNYSDETGELLKFTISEGDMKRIEKLNCGRRLTWKGVDPDQEK